MDIQVKVLPTPSLSEEGNIYQYIGITNDNYVNGMFYTCKRRNSTWSWNLINVQDWITEKANSIINKYGQLYVKNFETTSESNWAPLFQEVERLWESNHRNIFLIWDKVDKTYELCRVITYNIASDTMALVEHNHTIYSITRNHTLVKEPQSLRISVMPEASAKELGNVYEFTGVSDLFETEYRYICKIKNGVYYWEKLDTYAPTPTPTGRYLSIDPNQGLTATEKRNAKENINLEKVGNFKAVSTEPNQVLTTTEINNAWHNIKLDELSSDKVVKMTGYEKAEEADEITENDTLNEAIGKLEKSIEGISPIHTHTSDSITSMGSYVMGTGFAPITGSDTLNEAISKLENQIARKVSITGVLTTGSSIGKITIDGNETDILVNGVSGVSESSGDSNNGKIHIDYLNGTSSDVPVHGLNNAAYRDVDNEVTEDSENLITSGAVYDALDGAGLTDENVKQTPTVDATDTGEFEVLLAGDTSSTEYTGHTKKSNWLKFSPSTKKLFINSKEVSTEGHTHVSPDVVIDDYDKTGHTGDITDDDTLNEALAKLENALDDKAALLHTHVQSDIMMSGYIRGTDSSAVTGSDTLGQAIGKLENRIISGQGSVVSITGTLTSGSKIGTITVDGTSTDLNIQGVSSISGGSTDGTISVYMHGSNQATEVPVHGLDSAAYKNESYFAQAEHDHISPDVTIDDYTTTGISGNIEDDDTLNEALAKLENSVNSKASSTHVHSGADITTGVISQSVLPSATTSVSGIVQLSSSTGSTSEDMAATPKAVKIAYELAANHTQSSDTVNIDDDYEKPESYSEIDPGDTLTEAIGKLEAAIDEVAPLSHNHSSNDVTSMGSYSKLSDSSPVTGSDTLNQAISKLENQIDNKSTVSITGTLTSGASIGTITIDGTSTTLKVNGVSSISESTSNGKISVTNMDGTSSDVPIHGLGSAAYTNSTEYATAEHEHSGGDIDDMSGYTKASSVSAISEDDTLYEAIGKLEKALDSVAPSSHTHIQSEVTMSGYSRGTDSSAVTGSDTLGQAISKLENQIGDKSAVSITGTLASGSDIGTITIDGVSTTLKAPSGGSGGTDENVKQTPTTEMGEYPVLFSYTNDNTERTEGARKSNRLKFNPALSRLYILNSQDKSAFSVQAGSSTSYLIVGDYSLSGDNVSGLIRLYGTSTGANIRCVDLVPSTFTAHRTLYLPDKDGTLAITDDIPSITQVLTSGTKIATVTLGSATTDLYAPSGGSGGTDENVKQTNTTTNSSYNVLFSYSTNTTTTKTEGARKSSSLIFNPYTGLLSATGFSGSGSSLTSLNASNLSSGTVPNARLTSASTNTAGIVKLSDDIDSTSTTIAATANAVRKAYNLANGKSTVSFTQSLTEGTKIGSITINNSSTDLYAPSGSSTDENVKQTPTTGSGSYELLFSYTADNTTRTEGARKSNRLTFNPELSILTILNPQNESVFSFTGTQGIVTSNDMVSITLGNSLISSEDGNAYGMLRMYGTGRHRVELLTSTLTATRTLYLPNKDGTLAITDDIPSISPVLTEGTKIATVTLGSTTTDLYAPSGGTSTDENVKQTPSTGNANYEVLFSYTADNTTHTEGARKASNLTFNPSTGVLTATGVNAPVHINQQDGVNHVDRISNWIIENRTPSSGKSIDYPSIVRYNKISGDDYSYIAIWPNPVEYPTDDPNNEDYRGWGGKFGLVIKATELDFNGVKLYDSSTGLIPNARLTSATTSTAGIVKLSDDIDSTSTSLAATANSVKTAYDLANSKSTVSFTQTLTSGTEIGSITINNTPTKLYAPTSVTPDNDKVKQEQSESNDVDYQVLLSYTNSTSTDNANYSRKSSKLTFNPSTGTLTAYRFEIPNVTGYGTTVFTTQTYESSRASTLLSWHIDGLTPETTGDAFDYPGIVRFNKPTDNQSFIVINPKSVEYTPGTTTDANRGWGGNYGLVVGYDSLKFNGTTIKITDTTYSAGEGLELSGTTFNHSNSITAVTTPGLYKIKYDAQGHITGTSSVTASDLPSASISDVGVVQLSSSTSSSSTTLAATPSAVKSAYDLASSKSTVSFTRSLTEGTKIGTITINNTPTDLFAPSGGSSTDENVKQTNTTTDSSYNVLFSYSTNTTTAKTEGTRKSSNLTFNPSTGVLTATGVNAPVHINQQDGVNHVDRISVWRIENRTPSSGKSIDHPSIVRYNKQSGDSYSYIAIWPNPVEYPTDDPNNEDYRAWGGKFGLVIRPTELDFNGVKLYDSSTGLIPNARLTSASTDTAGIVQLSSSTSSDSTTTAATPSAVKSAYNLANSKSTVSFTQELTSGTKVGTITINNTPTDLFAPTSTTYSASDGLELSGTTFKHSNSITAVTTPGLYKIKYDAQGHITGTSSVTASDLPISDENVKQVQTNTSTTSETYEILFSNSSSTSTETATANKSEEFRLRNGRIEIGDKITGQTDELYCSISKYGILMTTTIYQSPLMLEYTPAASSTESGTTVLRLGQNKDIGNPYNAAGYIDIYNEHVCYHRIKASSSMVRDGVLVLPDDSGTLALTSDLSHVAYCTCSTAASTAAKVITIQSESAWKLKTGSMITVKFSATNTASNPTFNVNGTGAKSVYMNSAVITTSNLEYAGSTDTFLTYMYDGTYWVFVAKSQDSGTDTKVTQTEVTADNDYNVLFSSSTATTTTKTETSSKSAKLTFNPSTGTLAAYRFEIPDVSGYGSSVFTTQTYGGSKASTLLSWHLSNYTPASGKSVDYPGIVRFNKPTDNQSSIIINPQPVEYTTGSTAESVRGWGGNYGLVVGYDSLKFNGTTVKITDTTYSAGTGLTMSGTTIDHRDSITAVTTAGLYKIKFNSSGHITGTSSVTASDLPSHTHSYIPLTGSDSVTGRILSSAQFVSTGENAFRACKSGYGVIFRNDGSAFRILLTDKKTDGSEIDSNNWNDLRPFTIDLSNGNLTLQSRTTITGGSNPVIGLKNSNSDDVIVLQNTTNGTAGSTGQARVMIGNAKSTSSTGNAQGYLRLYDSTTYRADISTNTLSGDISIKVPNKGGTIALTSDVPTISVTQTLTSGTKIGSITINSSSTNLYAPAATTYSASGGLSLSGTTFSHSNSITAVTTAGLYKIKYDAQGHITGKSSVTSSDLPSHTHSYLPLTGGTLSGKTTISADAAGLYILRPTSGGEAKIQFGNNSGSLGYIGMKSVSGSLIRWNSNSATAYTILDTGNYASLVGSLKSTSSLMASSNLMASSGVTSSEYRHDNLNTEHPLISNSAVTIISDIDPSEYASILFYISHTDDPSSGICTTIRVPLNMAVGSETTTTTFKGMGFFESAGLLFKIELTVTILTSSITVLGKMYKFNGTTFSTTAESGVSGGTGALYSWGCWGEFNQNNKLKENIIDNNVVI